ncbi:Mesaconyl-C(4)-CoA hydratase [Cladobotryum mycophilum]|uniref:Mesaconyl-C(4)-CoA hydratase n=1 Tax=Cladobotryum mycophilum TaxID=491253 RepID=A0ABR0S9Y2_9HYPO
MSPTPGISVDEMKSRPAKVTRDFLSPIPSHLLTTTLSDIMGQTPSSPSPDLISSPSMAQLSKPGLLPAGHMLVYFPLQTPASQLSADAADADHAPSAEFGKRLWAGGELHFCSRSEGGDGGSSLENQGLVMDGRPWTCREGIEQVKVRGSGKEEKYFVDLRRTYGLGHREGDEAGRRPEEWDISEKRTLVFMRKPDDSDPPPPPPKLTKYPHPANYSVPLLPTPTHLFHFSALTYNAHSIHIDPLFAKSDGHRALLVHGPLSLSLMLRALADHLGSSTTNGGGDQQQQQRLSHFVYRNYAPLYVGERASVNVRYVGAREGERKYDVWVEGPEGGVAVKGTATVEMVQKSKL